MRARGLQFSSQSRQNAKSRENLGVQRKRSRSEIVEDPTASELPTEKNEDLIPQERSNKRPIIFPERVNRSSRPPMMEIDLRNLPDTLKTPPTEVHSTSYEEMLQTEEEYAADPDYLRKQRFLNTRMRAVLVDWLSEVAQEYGLKRDTFHFSLNYVDRYLSRQDAVARNELQLVGVTALWVASKMEEILPPPCTDFAAATDGGCNPQQMLLMESRLVQTLEWKLVPCTAFAFANYYLQTLAAIGRRRAKAEAVQSSSERRPWMVPTFVPSQQMNRVMEILDYALLDIDSLCFPPSMLAATAVMSLIKKDSSSVFTEEDIEKVTQYTKDELSDCITWFSFALNLPTAPAYTFRSAVVTAIPANELHIIQRHNQNAMAMIKDVISDRKGSRHPAAEHYILTMRQEAAMVSDDSDEDMELRVYAATKLHPGIAAVGACSHVVQRAFSPMTNISMQLENTSLTNGMTPHADTVPSPQRRIRFEDEH